jgi:hypothetical protein
MTRQQLGATLQDRPAMGSVGGSSGTLTDTERLRHLTTVHTAALFSVYPGCHNFRWPSLLNCIYVSLV